MRTYIAREEIKNIAKLDKDIKDALAKKPSPFLTMEESKLMEKFYNDIESRLPSIWTILYGDRAAEKYQEHLQNNLKTI